MIFATLVFGSENWLWPAAGLLALGLGTLAFSYWRSSGATGTRLGAATLKALGLTALASLLIEPLWSSTKPRSGENLFAVLVDNSQSLTIHDAGAAQSRGERIRPLMADDKAPWSVRLTQDFEVRRYLFDSRLQSTRNFAELNFDGRASALKASLQTLKGRYQGRPLAGILLLTDGNATDLDAGAIAAAGLPPVYPVVLGSDRSADDLAIENLAISQSAFEDAPVSLRADVAASGYAGKTVVAQLLDEKGEKVEEQTQRVQNAETPLAFRFQVRPTKPGVSFYQVQTAAQGELPALEDANLSKEASLANNRRLVAVDRGQGPYRVLYVSGRPNWEFKFLRRAVETDEQVQLIALMRIAKREAKFDFRGKMGETTNPLFKGFGPEADDTERYDQAVLIRLGTRDEAELRDGFPKTEEELYDYHAIIVDDLEAEFFTPDQLALVQRFVGERGGGLLMLGGQESFQQGKYHRTPLGELLPVYLDRATEPLPPGGLKLSLTREGWLQPWVRLRANETDENQRLASMPPFQAINRVEGIKPGASVLAAVSDAGGTQYPALVAQRFGNGRSGAMLLADLWRWQLKQDSQDPDLPKAWRQMVRWLVADVPQKLEIEARALPGDPQQPVRISVRVRDPRYKPLDNAAVTLTVKTPDGESLKLEAEAAAGETGLYETTYIPRTPGAYRAMASIADPGGVSLGEVETGWASDPAAEEFKALKPNRALLEKLAQDTGGEIVPVDGLESFVKSLKSRKMPVSEPTLEPLWNHPGIFLFAILCLAGEWGLRRMRGLA